MDELRSLAGKVQAERPSIPPELLSAQRQRLLADPRARVRTARSRWAAAATGALALSIAALGLIWVRSDRQASESAELSMGGATASDARAPEYRLQDGTRIQLDTGAVGQLEQNGPQDVRFELARGRAEFDVTPDGARMFRVLAGMYEVRVLGTRFSVSYDPAGELVVSVTRGVVSVASPGRLPERLEAGARLSTAGDHWLIERADNWRATAADAGSPPASEPTAPAVAAHDGRARAAQRRLKPAALPRDRAPNPDWRRLYRAGDYAGALRAARAEGLERLASTLEPGALADLADSARLGGDASAALELLATLERRFRGSEWAYRASFLSGRLLQREGRHTEAITQFERNLEQDPEGTHAAEARGRLMQEYSAIGERGRARGQAEAYLLRYPQGPYRLLASTLIASH